jgi:hypothetical protein
MKFSYFANVKNGSLPTSIRIEIQAAIRELEGKRVEVSIQTKNNRSDRQNGYYWGVIILCCQQGILETQGEKISKESAHSFLKYNCNYHEIVNEKTGEIVRIEKSSAKLSTVEFEEYQEQCRRFLKEWFGIKTPLPGEQLTIE